MKKNLKVLEGFETQTEQELHDVMGGALVRKIVTDLAGGGIMLLYGIRPVEMETVKLPLAKYGVYINPKTAEK